MSEETGKWEEFKDDADFLAKVRNIDATPEDVDRFHLIIERLTRKAALCERMRDALSILRLGNIILNQDKEAMDSLIAEFDREAKK